MDKYPRLRILSGQPQAVGSTIEIDGQPIQGCISSIRIEGAAGDVWRVHVEFHPGTVDVDVLVGHFTGTPHAIEVERCAKCGEPLSDITRIHDESRRFGCTNVSCTLGKAA